MPEKGMDVIVSGPFDFEIENGMVFVTMGKGVTGVQRLALSRHDAYAALALYKRVVAALEAYDARGDVVEMRRTGH